MLDEENKARFQKLKDDFEHYAARCLKIRLKVPDPITGEMIVPFRLNRVQKYIHATVQEQLEKIGKIRAIILKARQEGASTYIGGRLYWRVTHAYGVRAFILTHEEKATANLFEIVKRFQENCHPAVRPRVKASNARELSFEELDSGYKLGTAGNRSIGRSSTIQFLHASEAAFYAHAEEHAKGIWQSVPDGPKTEIFIESTANGVGNWFHQQWQRAETGESEYLPIFTPWYWQDEYRKELQPDFSLTGEEKELAALYQLDNKQLMWRRAKIIEWTTPETDGEKFFKQEYPANAAEAFQVSGQNTFIEPILVMAARRTVAEKYGPLLMGVDIAREGTDRTAIIFRQGRVAFGLRTYRNKNLMETVGIIHTLIGEYHPAKVFIDICGMGVGVYDRLMELGHGDILVGVNSAKSALDEGRYSNKRAEVWALLKRWLMDGPVQIPDLDSLHADLCAPKAKVDSQGRLLIEKKEDMKARQVRSSDEADALCYTFAIPVPLHDTKGYSDSEKAKIITSVTRQVAQYRRRGS